MVAMIAAAALMMAAAEPAAPVVSAPDLVATLRACSGVGDDDRRLACYDRAAAALGSALDSRAVAVVDREAVRRTQRSLFGFITPKFSVFGLGTRDDRHDEEVKQLTGVVRSAREIATDRYEIRLDDDAVWKTTDAARRPPRAGDKVTITKAALGSYFMTVGGGRIGTRCTRVR